MAINLEINTASQATKDNIVRGLFSTDTESELKTKVRGLSSTPRTLTLVTENGVTSAYDFTSIPDNFKYNEWGSVIYDVTQLQIGNDVTSIGSGAFSYCVNLTGPLTIPGSVTAIGSYAFYYTGISNLVLPDACAGIGNGAFSSSAVTGQLIIPDRCIAIGEAAFYNCSNITSLVLGKSLTTISSAAFQGCFLLAGTLTIPQSVTSIGNAAFAACAISGQLIIPEGVTSLGNGAFYDNTNITSVVLPSTLSSFGVNVFQNCSSLTTLYVACNASAIIATANSSFSGTSINKIYYKAGTVGWTNPWFGVPTAVWTNYPNPIP